ncbi:MAG: class I SAM-dependent methyltransferase [Nanoarchaeota archaeon]|nr:class I SAM-dependent methyltransferase [Nanoarchaeota archaeon]
MEPIVSSQIKHQWRPYKLASKGATAYHNAVVNAHYYVESLDKLANMVCRKIRDGDIVVDFGAGTGVSALHLLKRLKASIRLWLVDNSPAWLGKAYEVFSNNPNVECFLLEKKDDRYATLAETVGEESVDHVVSANTVHLIPDLEDAFKGIYSALKPRGSFTFQSGNIMRKGRKNGVLMIDDTVKRVHEMAMEIVNKSKRFVGYRKNIDDKAEKDRQRQIIFPDPRPLEYYLKILKNACFDYGKPYFMDLRIAYKDWMRFLKVRRLQAGILPEVGGKDPSPQEEKDRDDLITMATNQLFDELQNQNPMADEKSFTVELISVRAFKGYPAKLRF